MKKAAPKDGLRFGVGGPNYGVMEKAILRIFVRFAVPIIALSGPICLIGIVWGYALILESAPLWVFLIICFSTWVTVIAVASLFDRSHSQDGRQSDAR